MSRKWNWCQNEVDEEKKVADSRNKAEAIKRQMCMQVECSIR